MSFLTSPLAYGSSSLGSLHLDVALVNALSGLASSAFRYIYGLLAGIA